MSLLPYIAHSAYTLCDAGHKQFHYVKEVYLKKNTSLNRYIYTETNLQ
jgi:hypothetical protein